MLPRTGEMPSTGSLATGIADSVASVASHICGRTSLSRRMMSSRLPRSRLRARDPVRKERR